MKSTTKKTTAGQRPLAEAVLEELIEGNRRFVEGSGRALTGIGARERAGLVEAQHPVATVLGCSDSRVIPELIFDQGPGQLFVIRVAGNIADPAQIASIEFAVEALGSPLIIVLGHTGCGAVSAAVDGLLGTPAAVAADLSAVLGFIEPAARFVVERDAGHERTTLIDSAVKENVTRTVSVVRNSVAPSARRGSLQPVVVAGAVYSLQTGAVTFLDGTSSAGIN